MARKGWLCDVCDELHETREEAERHEAEDRRHTEIVNRWGAVRACIADAISRNDEAILSEAERIFGIKTPT